MGENSSWSGEGNSAEESSLSSGDLFHTKGTTSPKAGLLRSQNIIRNEKRFLSLSPTRPIALKKVRQIILQITAVLSTLAYQTGTQKDVTFVLSGDGAMGYRNPVTVTVDCVQ
jgi:hypothetical protein